MDSDKEQLATEARRLFAEVDRIEGDVKQAEALLRDAETARSAKLGEIAKAVGLGPFVRRGIVHRIVEKAGVYTLHADPPKPKGLVID